MAKEHQNASTGYKAKKATRDRRARDREIHALAKAIHFAMKDGTIDMLTGNTFKWINNRPTAAERECQIMDRVAN